MSFLELLVRFALAFIILVLPGFALAWRLLRATPPRERFILATALGFAGTIYAGYHLTLIHLNVAIIGIAVAAIIAAIYLLVLALRAQWTFSRDGFARNGWLAAIALGGTALRLYPLWISEYPSGSDSAFHLILARKIVLFGQLPTDWTPFENIAVNYTLGSHLFTALVSVMGSIPLHRAFALVMIAEAALSAALIYVIGKAIFRRESLALWSAFAYAFVAVLGSLDYYRWGGLPNETGMTLLLASLALILLDRGRAALLLASLTLAALYIAHHHSMLATFAIFGAMIPTLWVARQRDLARRFFFAGVGSALLGAAWLVPYALKAGKLGETIATGFWLFFIKPWEIPTEIGLVYTLIVGPGLVGLYGEWKKSRDAKLLAWGTWAAILFLAFAALEYGYRALAKLMTGTALTAFTSAHFLTDAVYPFAFAAGWTLERAANGLSRFARAGKALIATGTALLVIGVGVTTVYGQGWVVIQSDEMMLYRWIDANTPRDAMILENPYWLEYLTWREASLTPLPVTEPVTNPSVVFKQEVLGKRNWGEIAKWQKQTGRSVYMVTRDSTLDQPGWKPVFYEGRWRVYEFSSQ